MHHLTEQVLHVRPALNLYFVLLVLIVELNPLAHGSPRPVDAKYSVQVVHEPLQGLLWVRVLALELAQQELEVYPHHPALPLAPRPLCFNGSHLPTRKDTLWV